MKNDARTGNGAFVPIREGRLGRALAIALVMHAALLASLRAASAGTAQGTPPSRPAAEGAEIEVELRKEGSPPPSGREASSPRDVKERARTERRRAPLGPRPRLPLPPPPREGSGPSEGAPTPTPDPGDGQDRPPDADVPAVPGESGFGLSLADRIALAPGAAPAPTAPPARPPLTPESVEKGLRSAIRERDESLGLGAPERSIVTSAVKTALFRTPAESGTRVGYAVAIDREGTVTSVERLHTSSGDEAMWRGADGAIRGALANRRIPLGMDARRAGVRLVVEASILHVLPQGTVDGHMVAECIPPAGMDPHAKPDFPSSGFFAVGGTLFGDLPSGTCDFYEDPTAIRHIEVRTTTTSVFAEEPPPPGKPKPRQILPWIKKPKPTAP